MHRIWKSLLQWLEAWTARPCQPDPLDGLSMRTFADLPPSHPRCRAC